jgi:hypothetical protein
MFLTPPKTIDRFLMGTTNLPRCVAVLSMPRSLDNEVGQLLDL